MGKVLAMLPIILLALVSVTGYLFLTGGIIAGEIQIADGQRQIKKRTARIQGRGKTKLEAGKRGLLVRSGGLFCFYIEVCSDFIGNNHWPDLYAYRRLTTFSRRAIVHG